MIHYETTVGPAWTCQKCGALVYGPHHTCYEQPAVEYQFLMPTDYHGVLDRIAIALERIAASLEKQRA